MASSSKRGASSRKQKSAGKARAISVRRKDTLPRTGTVSAGPRKPQTGTAASRTKTTRAGGRASGKLKKPAAVEAPSMVAAALAPALEAPEVEALPIFDTETEVDVSAIVEETTIGEPPPLPVRAMTFPSTAIGQLPFSDETRGPPLPRMAAERPARAEPAPHHGKGALMTVASRLLSTLCRWTGVRP